MKTGPSLERCLKDRAIFVFLRRAETLKDRNGGAFWLPISLSGSPSLSTVARKATVSPAGKHRNPLTVARRTMGGGGSGTAHPDILNQSTKPGGFLQDN
ncbi:Hypothetical protein NTJ_08174 [Nesidiocoris tenuis]|uniref:Uncharacterized protein n=1 Tax=Nesidiocoris tenuis TaxID=355587 RepID=A0ABN7AT35_9HEMI|nr:Hypothetical protein NTJ_08174 [Nesidiocoris tenuis]